MATHDVSSETRAHGGAGDPAADARRRLRAFAAAAEGREPAGEVSATRASEPPADAAAVRAAEAPAATVTGWVPAREAATPPGTPRWSRVGETDAGHEEGTVTATADGLRRRALAAAVTGYTAAHGHPLEHPTGGGGSGGRRRWAVRPGAVVVAVVVLLLVVGLVGWRALRPAPSTVVDRGGTSEQVPSPSAAPDGDAPVGASGDAGAGPSGDAGAASPSGADVGDAVVVHVVGEVAAPGVLTLPVGARVVDAIDEAGGPLPTADVAALNLARELVDGEQVVVPRPGDPPPAPVVPSGAVAAPGTPLDLNAADLAALDGLPGIGPVLAERILAWRDEHGRFTTVEELAEVPGIGPSLLGDLRDLVRV